MKISTSSGHQARRWKAEEMSWTEFTDRVRRYTRAECTRAEFDQLTHDQQAGIKAQGGAFVGGALRDGSRKRDDVESRELITLDIDNAPADIVDRVNAALEVLDCCGIIYSTFRSTPEALRVRVVVPLQQAIPQECYEPVARGVANMIDIEAVDTASYKANQLMFWPVYAQDATPIIEEIPGEPLDVKTVTSTVDIDDVRSWPRAHKEAELRAETARMEDPTVKEGPVGTFCRTYSITKAIETFIPDVYTHVEGDRWHFNGADSTAGAIVYDDKFFYSHHASDPAGGIECNAFDLVRIHRFGDLDASARAGTAHNKLPSFLKMIELTYSDAHTVKVRAYEDFHEMQLTDPELVEEVVNDTSTDWQTQLDRDKNGNVKNTLSNIGLIIQFDTELQSIKYDLFADLFCVDGPLPWRHEGRAWSETDLAALCVYISTRYGINASANVFTALTATVHNCRAYHPVRDYLNALVWDGTQRIDELFIRYLGAEDTPLCRAITHKTMVAAVARVMQPGIKFDTMTVLVGGQGIGKSTLFKVLAGDWFSDSLTLADMKDKTGVEKLRGAWISEIAELSGMRRTDSETIKGFITRREDRMRPAYGHTIESRPREGIFIGTTNEVNGFLRDLTGNRRYLIVETSGVPGFGPARWDLSQETVGQLWAEAMHCYKQHESLYLPEELQKQAAQVQDRFLEDDARGGIVQRYLDTLLPEGWDDMELYQRIDYLEGRGSVTERRDGKIKRDRVSVIEIWCECFHEDRSRLKRVDSNEIVAILVKLGWSRTGPRMQHIYGVQRLFKAPKNEEKTLPTELRVELPGADLLE